MDSLSDKIGGVLDVASGEKELKVGLETDQIVVASLLIMLAVFIGVFAANKLSK